MKEINIFSNIKPTKLKEEINKSNKDNSHLHKNKNNVSNQKELKINGTYKGLKFCILYLILFIFLISILIFNYLKTKDAFKENKYINLSSEKICDRTIKLFSECIKEKTLIKCQYENKAVEYCYDESYSMNLMCFTYIRELNLCLKKNKNNVKYCENNINEIVRCASIYRFLKLNKEYLKQIINSI